ncbi:hypothetical protein Pelo_17544 [Pelomyxa schiedti]|nr:hypothetical protein Pelo_17544 [Pelomyxa schiedti]
MVVDDTSAVPGVDGKPDGRGTLKWPDGGTYDGVWLNGDTTGRGVYKWPDGSTCEGEWLNDKRDGGGVCKGGQSRGGATGAMVTVYEGEWDRGKWHGVGMWKSPDGLGDIYHGQFDHGMKCGTGRILFGGGGDYGGNNSKGCEAVGKW